MSPINFRPEAAQITDRLLKADVRSSPAVAAIAKAAGEAFGAEMALVSLLDHLNQRVIAPATMSPSIIHRTVSFCDLTVRRGEATYIADTSADYRTRYNPAVLCAPYVRSYLGAPVHVEGQLVGTVCVFSPRIAAFTDAMDGRLARLANEAAAAMTAWLDPQEGVRRLPA